MTDRAAIASAVDQATEQFGGLDIVVANAGVAPPAGSILSVDEDVFERVVEIDLLGVYRTVRAGLPQIADRGGHVVVVASIYAFVNGVSAASYAISKAGVEQLGRALRAELSLHGASASVAYFGFIDTTMVHETIDEDPLGLRLLELVPSFLRKRLPPSAAGEAVARGIERRAPRIIAPRRWAVLQVLRGVLNPLLDPRLERDPKLQELYGGSSSARWSRASACSRPSIRHPRSRPPRARPSSRPGRGSRWSDRPAASRSRARFRRGARPARF